MSKLISKSRCERCGTEFESHTMYGVVFCLDCALDIVEETVYSKLKYVPELIWMMLSETFGNNKDELRKKYIARFL